MKWKFASSPNAYGKVAVFEDGKLIADVPSDVADALKALQARIAVLEDRLTSLIRTREQAAKEIAKLAKETKETKETKEPRGGGSDHHTRKHSKCNHPRLSGHTPAPNRG